MTKKLSGPAKPKKEKRIKVVFDLKLLAEDVFAERSRADLSFGAAEKVSGIKKAKIQHVESMRFRPNCDTLAQFLAWLGTPADKYFITK